MFILKTMNIIDSPVVLLSLAERSYWPKAQRSSDQRKWSVSVLLLWLLLRTLQSKREKDWKKWIPFPKIFIDLHRGKLQMFNHSVLTNQVFLSRVVFGLQHTWWAVSQVTNHRNWTVPGRHLNKARADMLPLRLLSLIERRRLHSSSDANKLNFTLLLSRPLFILGASKKNLVPGPLPHPSPLSLLQSRTWNNCHRIDDCRSLSCVTKPICSAWIVCEWREAHYRLLLLPVSLLNKDEGMRQ